MPFAAVVATAATNSGVAVSGERSTRVRVRRTARATWAARMTASFAVLPRFLGTTTVAALSGTSASEAVRDFCVT